MNSLGNVPALELTGVHKQFGLTQVIRGVDMHIAQGDRVALIGPNGAGKSTLFNILSGLAPPDVGSVRLLGREVSKSTPPTIHRLGLSRSFQITSAFRNLTVFDNLRCAVLGSTDSAYSVWTFLSRSSSVNTRVEQLLSDLGLNERRFSKACDLSYAEQRTLELGMALAANSAVLLLDEPTAGMNRSESEQCTDLIKRLTTGKTLLVVEHDMQVAFALADKIAVLVEGRVLAFDTPDRIRQNAAVQEAYLGVAMDEDRAC